MRTMRGIQITSLVVLSPVLLCIISLISILFSTLFEWIFPTFQPSLPIKTIQRNSYRLRKTSILLVIFCLYLSFILFKKKRNKKVVHQPVEETERIVKKRKNPKKRKVKKMVKSNVNNKPIKNHLEDNQQNHKDDWHHPSEYQDTLQQSWHQDKPLQQEQEPIHKDITIQQEDTIMEEEEKDTQMEEEEKDTQIETPIQEWHHIDTSIKPEEHTPELTPIESEDEDHKPFKNWYSPFSTGLDLDIVPKRTSPELDPLKYNTSLPVLSNAYPTRPHSIEILENYPFIPSHSHSPSFTHSFGPIGDKKKQVLL